MDKNAHIYRAQEDEIPEEDKARLDGYLTAKAEEGERARLIERFEKIEARMRKEAAAGLSGQETPE